MPVRYFRTIAGRIVDLARDQRSTATVSAARAAGKQSPEPPAFSDRRTGRDVAAVTDREAMLGRVRQASLELGVQRLTQAAVQRLDPSTWSRAHCAEDLRPPRRKPVRALAELELEGRPRR
jgi:hypothetical protein